MRRKEEILLAHCETVGRDPAEIERTTGIGTVFIRDDRAEAERLFHAAFERNRDRAALGGPAGRARPRTSPRSWRRRSRSGYRHLIAGIPADYDEESMTRFATEVRPLLEKV